jgi:hypothetical protein
MTMPNTAQPNRAFPESDPRHHTAKIKGMLDEIVRHVREDAGKVSEPKAQAIFETTAEVLLGLEKAYDDYEKQAESAMRHG